MPLVFLILNIRIFSIKANAFVIILWLSFIGIGISINYFILRKTIVQADKKNQLISLQGEKTTLLFLLMFLVIKFYFGFKTAIDTNIFNDLFFFYKYVAISALSFGVFIGKTLVYFYKYKMADSIDLKKAQS